VLFWVRSAFGGQDWANKSTLCTFAFIDEAHVARNPDTKTAQAIWALRKWHGLCLTGAPAQVPYLVPSVWNPPYCSIFRIPIMIYTVFSDSLG
jgi:hypothetical protein